MITRFFSYLIAFFYLLIFCIPIGLLVYILSQIFYPLGLAKRFIKKRLYDNRPKNRK